MKLPLRFEKIPWISALVLLFTAMMLMWLAGRPAITEKIYTRSFYTVLTPLVTSFSSLFAFSISEIFLYANVLGFCLLLALGLYRKKWRWALTGVLRWAAFAIVWFYLGWGCNYFRLPLAEQLRLPKQSAVMDSLALRRNLLWSISQTNRAWRPVPPGDIKQLDEEIERQYQAVCDTLRLPLMPGKRPPKFLLFPGLFHYTLTSGMFGPFFHEIHLNNELLPVELPFVLAHEKAHQMGFAREAEANFLAALVCWSSADSAVQYSAHFSILGHFAARAYFFSDQEALRQGIRPQVREDFARVRRRYQKYEGPVSEISHKSYDAYLRANRVEGGAQNYNDVVDLIIRWRERHGANETTPGDSRQNNPAE